MGCLCIKDLHESPSNYSNDNRNEIKQPMAFNIAFLPNLAPEVKSLQISWMLQMNSFIFLFIRVGIYPVLTHKKLLFKNHSLKWRGPPGMVNPMEKNLKNNFLFGVGGYECIHTHTHTRTDREMHTCLSTTCYFLYNPISLS